MNRILRNAGGKTVDEIVISNCTFHIEQMSDNCYWIGITTADGQDVSMNLSADFTLSLTMQDEDIVWDEDETHEGIEIPIITDPLQDEATMWLEEQDYM